MIKELKTDKEKLELLAHSVAVNHSVRPETVLNAFTKLWLGVKYYMAMPELPRIILKNFGTFAPSLPYIEKKIEKIENGSLQNRGGELERLGEVRARLQSEKSSRKHIPNKDPNAKWDPKGKKAQVQGTTGDSSDIQ